MRETAQKGAQPWGQGLWACVSHTGLGRGHRQLTDHFHVRRKGDVMMKGSRVIQRQTAGSLPEKESSFSLSWTGLEAEERRGGWEEFWLHH